MLDRLPVERWVTRGLAASTHVMLCPSDWRIVSPFESQEYERNRSSRRSVWLENPSDLAAATRHLSALDTRDLLHSKIICFRNTRTAHFPPYRFKGLREPSRRGFRNTGKSHIPIMGRIIKGGPLRVGFDCS